jgi:hypothetical protein
MSDWQAIGNAPRNESELLLATEDGRVVIGYWSQEPAPDGGWFLQSGRDSIFPPPVAWLPLPSPPGGIGRSRSGRGT